MITQEQIGQLIQMKIEGTDQFVVEAKVDSNNNISIELDADGGLSIRDCARLSKHIKRELEESEENFSIHVSSPGLDKPLRMHRQYLKNVGRTLNVQCIEGERLKGELKKVNDSSILLEKDKKEIEIEFSNIKEAKIVVGFK